MAPPLAPPALLDPSLLASPTPNASSLLAPPIPNIPSLLAPPAHGDWPLGPTRGPTVQRASGGAWGEASPQTPAICLWASCWRPRDKRSHTLVPARRGAEALNPSFLEHVGLAPARRGAGFNAVASPMTVSPCPSLWRGSGGRHLPRLPRRGRGGGEGLGSHRQEGGEGLGSHRQEGGEGLGSHRQEGGV